jgi:CRP/FNR family cyclic AMP-dependent transcriptional regulator
MQPDPEQLTKIPLFESLSPDERQAIATLCELRDEPSGACLVGEAAPGYSLFVVQQGRAAVTSRGEQLDELEPGDFFGEIALLADHERTATVTAITPMKLIVMHGSDFRVFERDWPDASALLRKTLAERLARSRPRA